MLKPILDAINTDEFEDNGWIAIAASDCQGRDVSLRIEANLGGDGQVRNWTLVCKAVRAIQIQHAQEERIELFDDHILLLPYQQVHGQLFIASAPANVMAVLGDLWLAHREATNDWFQPHQFLNPHVRLRHLLESGSGLLASGPRAILDAYARVLEQHKVVFTVIGEHEPVHWEDGRWVPESEALHALVVGESFVVAESFACPRVSNATFAE